ncbi:MAG TPA: glycosyltransferase [Planctomycetota bacterium]|nr:glycosyltransferase [Planctomycetota bacterium]
MRVVRIITRLNRGGPLRQLDALVPGLAERGIEGPVWVGRPEAGEEDAADELARRGVRVERVPGLSRGMRPGDDARAFRWMRRRLSAERPDVVHTHLAKAGALGRLCAASLGIRTVVHTFHGHHLTAPFPAGRAARLAERALAPLAAAIVCLSEGQRRDLVERFRVVPASRAVVIGPGLDVPRLRARADALRASAIRARVAPDGRPVALWLGRFAKVKRPLALLDAIGSLPRGTLRLVLAGDGPLLPAARARARALGLEGDVVFVGPVSDAPDWILASDLVVLASASEGTPLALLEAMALGRPVVSTAVGGVPDVVEHEATGLLASPGDGAEGVGRALARLAADAGLRARLGAEGARRVESAHSAERLVEGTAALYARILGRAEPGTTFRPPVGSRTC